MIIQALGWIFVALIAATVLVFLGFTVKSIPEIRRYLHIKRL